MAFRSGLPSDQTPKHLYPKSLVFSVFTAEDIKNLSVVKICTPLSFNVLGHPLRGGLYDPSLGPLNEHSDPCGTCGENVYTCTGHFGHIELPVLVVNPLFHKVLCSLVKLSCLNCFTIQIPAHVKLVLSAKLKLINEGFYTDLEGLEQEVASVLSEPAVGQEAQAELVREAVDGYVRNLHERRAYGKMCEGEVQVHTKNVNTLWQIHVESVVKMHKPEKVCLYCKIPISKVSILKNRIMISKAAIYDDEHRGVAQKTMSVLLMPDQSRKYMRRVWDNDREILKLYENFSKSPLWNDLDELPPAFRSNTHIGAILKRCGGYLRELKIGDPCTYKILGLVGEYCVNLSRLEVSFDRYGQRFTTLFSKMNKLGYFGMKNLGKDVFQDFWGHSINNLREIHLCSQHCEENGTVRPRIYSSGLKQFTNLTAMTLEGFTLEPGVIRLISANPDLTCLSLANSRAKNFSPLTKLFSLEHLNLSKIINIGDDFITALTNNSRNLRYLNLNRCPGITTGGLSNLGNLPHLEELFLNSCRITDDVFKRLRSLKKLECEDCWSVDDPGITTLVNNSPNLRYLNLAGTNVTEKVLKTASSVTGRRNNFCLWVIVDKIVKTKWERSEDHGKCHLLIVDEANKIDNFDNDDRSLMEIYEESRLITNPELERLNQLRYNY